MKKQISKIRALIFTILLSVIVTGCGNVHLNFKKNKRADDAISKAIYKAVGKKVYYRGKHYTYSGELVGYHYLVQDYEDENLLTDIVETVNAVMQEKEIAQKISLVIREEMTGGNEPVAYLRNYYEGEDEDGYVQYETLQTLYIYGTEFSNMGDASPYNKASTYINLPDIQRLVVTEKIAQNAEDEGIDWYEIWPDLEYYEVMDDCGN